MNPKYSFPPSDREAILQRIQEGMEMKIRLVELCQHEGISKSVYQWWKREKRLRDHPQSFLARNPHLRTIRFITKDDVTYIDGNPDEIREFLGGGE